MLDVKAAPSHPEEKTLVQRDVHKWHKFNKPMNAASMLKATFRWSANTRSSRSYVQHPLGLDALDTLKMVSQHWAHVRHQAPCSTSVVRADAAGSLTLIFSCLHLDIKHVLCCQGLLTCQKSPGSPAAQHRQAVQGARNAHMAGLCRVQMRDEWSHY